VKIAEPNLSDTIQWIQWYREQNPALQLGEIKKELERRKDQAHKMRLRSKGKWCV